MEDALDARGCVCCCALHEIVAWWDEWQRLLVCDLSRGARNSVLASKRLSIPCLFFYKIEFLGRDHSARIILVSFIFFTNNVCYTWLHELAYNLFFIYSGVQYLVCPLPFAHIVASGRTGTHTPDDSRPGVYRDCVHTTAPFAINNDISPHPFSLRLVFPATSLNRNIRTTVEE